MRETWLPVTNYEGKYEVSNLGRVKNVQTGRILSKHLNKGYQMVGLTTNNKTKIHGVHRIMATAFFGESKLDVDHKNGIKHHNKLSNLHYVEHRDNLALCYRRKGRAHTGVRKRHHCNSWAAEIYIKGKNIHIGSYRTKKAALVAYKAYRAAVLSALEKIR